MNKRKGVDYVYQVVSVPPLVSVLAGVLEIPLISFSRLTFHAFSIEFLILFPK